MTSSFSISIETKNFESVAAGLVRYIARRRNAPCLLLCQFYRYRYLVDLIKYVEATERVARRSDVSPFATIRYEIK